MYLRPREARSAAACDEADEDEDEDALLVTKARLLLHVEKARRPVGSSAMTLLVRYFISDE